MHHLSIHVLICIGAFMSIQVGCNRDTSDRYSPSSSTARLALETALKTWKSGASHRAITDSKPAIDVFDARWQAGKKLEAYTIEEEIIGERHPQFKVKMKVAGTPEETTMYLIVGIDPLLVFRDIDYRKTTGM